MCPTPARVDRLWGITSTNPLTGVLTGLCGAAVLLGAAFLGDWLGFPGLLLGTVLFVIFAIQAVLQATRLTFTDTHLLRDTWMFVVRRRDSVAWEDIEALGLHRDEENESTSRWTLLLRPRAPPSPDTGSWTCSTPAAPHSAAATAGGARGTSTDTPDCSRPSTRTLSP